MLWNRPAPPKDGLLFFSFPLLSFFSLLSLRVHTYTHISFVNVLIRYEPTIPYCVSTLSLFVRQNMR